MGHAVNSFQRVKCRKALNDDWYVIFLRLNPAKPPDFGADMQIREFRAA